MDNTDISTSSKSKAPASINNIEAYSKKALGDKIRRLITTNVQLMVDKTETEKAKVNLEVDRIRLFGKKNSLIAKKKELRAEIVALNVVGPPNISIHRH